MITANDEWFRFGLVKPAALHVYGVHTTQSLLLPATVGCNYLLLGSCKQRSTSRLTSSQTSSKLRILIYSVKIDQTLISSVEDVTLQIDYENRQPNTALHKFRARSHVWQVLGPNTLQKFQSMSLVWKVGPNTLQKFRTRTMFGKC